VTLGDLEGLLKIVPRSNKFDIKCIYKRSFSDFLRYSRLPYMTLTFFLGLKLKSAFCMEKFTAICQLTRTAWILGFFYNDLLVFRDSFKFLCPENDENNRIINKQITYK